jgi:hypothetical protein
MSLRKRYREKKIKGVGMNRLLLNGRGINSVIINRNGLGFTISKKAIDILKTQGIDDYEKLLECRHSNKLIKLMEYLGPDFSDEYHDLWVFEIPSHKYKIIECYRGMSGSTFYEDVVTPDDNDWIEIKE